MSPTRALRNGILTLFLSGGVAGASDPGWWPAPGAPANNKAVATIGQLKNLAAAAKAHLEDTSFAWGTFPGGSGSGIDDLLASWNPPSVPENSNALQLGQLKHVASLFYDRLILNGYAVKYPWSAVPDDDSNLSPAVLGQLKNVFAFDLSADSDSDGLPDMWELARFGDLSAYDGAGDPDGDGLDNAGEVASGTDPWNTDSDGDGAYDGLAYQLLAYWPLDQETPPGQTPDLAGSNHGTLQDGAELVSGSFVGSSTKFTGGTSSRTEFSPDFLQGVGDLTLSFWIRTDSTSNCGIFEAANSANINEFLIWKNATSIRFYTGKSSGNYVSWPTAGLDLNSGRWQQCTFVRDDTNDLVTFYLNGERVGEPEPAVGMGVLNNILGGWCVAGLHQSNPVPLTVVTMDGELDEIRIHGRTMNPDEVAMLYRASGDADGDLLPDWWERQYFASTIPAPDEDPDRDGKTNIDEFYLGTDPRGVIPTNGTELVGHWKLDELADSKVLADSSLASSFALAIGTPPPCLIPTGAHSGEQ